MSGKLIIFDWDGTLIDSLERIVGAMQRAAIDLELPPRSDEAIRDIIGLALGLSIEILYPDLNPDLREQIRQRYVHHFTDPAIPPSKPYPGVVDLLPQLRKQGFVLAVATGKSRRGLDLALGEVGFEPHFVATRCADETASKPDPKMVEELLAETGFASREAILVGDTEYDMEMALRAGVARIAVTYGSHSASRLAAYQPLVTVNRSVHLLKKIELACKLASTL